MKPENDRYDSLIEHAWDLSGAAWGFAEDHSVDWRLLKAQVKAESGFNPWAVSKVGAMGLLQLMPTTFGSVDLEQAKSPFNPEINLVRGAGYLGQQWAEFKSEDGLERWRFALAAYNAGLGNILKAQGLASQAKAPTNLWGYVGGFLNQVTGPDNSMETLLYVRGIMSDFLSSRAS